MTPIPNEPIGFSAHEYASIAGATPNATTSDRLSYSTPNWLEVREARATRPSSPSQTNAITIITAPTSKCPLTDATIE